MILVENINKSFGKLKILKNINLQIQKAEVVAIVGKSGAGKTTLLQIIGSLLKPDSGRVLINDTDIYKLSDKQLSVFRNKHIGFVFQFHNLLPEFTAVENVALPAMIAGENKSKAFERAKELLRFLNLGDRLEHKPNQLSGGEQQRVAVARALINNPDIILADEPSGNLDSAHKTDLHKLFFDLREQFQQTFVIVTHDEQLAQISDRIIRLKDGQIIP